MRSRPISSVASVIAILSLLFLPVAGCMEYNKTGLEILQEDGIEAESKLYLVAAICFAFVILFLANRIARATFAILGFLSLMIGYFIVFAENELIELRIGAIVSLLSYLLIALVNTVISEQQPTISAVSSISESEGIP